MLNKKDCGSVYKNDLTGGGDETMSGVLVKARIDYWGVMTTDWIPKRESMCARCCQQTDICNDTVYICDADYDIKFHYKYGRTKKAMDMLRRLPTEALKAYLSNERRTPIELKAVILDELQAREKEEVMRL